LLCERPACPLRSVPYIAIKTESLYSVWYRGPSCSRAFDQSTDAPYAHPPGEPSPGCLVGRGSESSFSLSGTGVAASRRRRAPHLFSDRLRHLAALRDGERSDGGNLRGGKWWSCRRRLVLGGRNHPEQGGRAERRQRLPIAADSAQRRVQSPRRVADADVALHALPHHANGPDGGLQPAPHFGPAVLPLAVAFPGPPAEQYLDDDPGIDWYHAGRAPRRRHRGCGQAAKARRDSILARPNHGD